MSLEEAIKGYETWHEYQHPEFGKIVITNYGKNMLLGLRNRILSRNRKNKIGLTISTGDRKTIKNGTEKQAAEKILHVLAFQTARKAIYKKQQRSTVYRPTIDTPLIIKTIHPDSKDSVNEDIGYHQEILDLLKGHTTTKPQGEHAAISFLIPQISVVSKPVVLTIPKIYATIGKKTIMMPNLEGERDDGAVGRVNLAILPLLSHGITGENALVRPRVKDNKTYKEVQIYDLEHLLR